MPKVTKIQPQKPILPPRKKVAAYARVSKDTEQLMHSLSAQISYYSTLIQKKPEWEFAGVYVDAGLTGTSTDARPEFRRLVADCEAGKINIVLTKSISRFARNTVDLLSTVRHLKELGVEVRFEKENISSMTGDGEVMLSILASFAQEESTSLSRNIKWTVQKKYKEGKVHSHQKMLGYEWHGDEMTIVPEEAETVRFIFDSYIAGKSTGEIARELAEKGIKSVHGKPFPQASVVRILQNEQYTGCLILQQSFNYRPKKQKLNYGEMPMYRIDGHHPAIISEETFAEAMKVKEQRGKAAERDPQFGSDFSKMVWCGKCGCKASWHRSPQARKRGDMSSMIWICNGRNRQKGCDCRNIQDRDIHAAVNALGLEIGRIERIEMFDEKLKFHMKNGRTETWRRT
jgi:Site-specific recombinases, DNA invertase Pin homologs